jgi:hypothetical protein
MHRINDMQAWVQNILAITLVALCGGWALWQGIKSMSGKRSKLGSCCAKGCGAAEPKPAETGAATEKVHFLPSEMLRKR